MSVENAENSIQGPLPSSTLNAKAFVNGFTARGSKIIISVFSYQNWGFFEALIRPGVGQFLEWNFLGIFI